MNYLKDLISYNLKWIAVEEWGWLLLWAVLIFILERILNSFKLTMPMNYYIGGLYQVFSYLFFCAGKQRPGATFLYKGISLIPGITAGSLLLVVGLNQGTWAVVVTGIIISINEIRR